MKEPLDVLALGRACVDEILELEAFPAEDSKRPLAARLREGGGQASTAACLVGQLGGKAAFFGVLGEDEAGRFARARMEDFRVGVFGPVRGQTPLAYCLVSRAAGTRTILYERSDPAPLSWAELPPDLLASARVVLADPQAGPLLPDLLPACRELGVAIVADAEHAAGGWRETWGRVDVLAASETFLREAFPGLPVEEAVVSMATESSGLAVATAGPLGAFAVVEGRLVRLPAPAVAVRDTTGAGDAFHGALALALARGFDSLDAVRYGVAAASLSCRGLGGRSFPCAEEVDQVFREVPALQA